jgi:prophage regulatory protein
MKTRLITIAEAADRVSLSKSEIYRRMANGTFPSRIQLGPKRVAFVEQDIEAWIAAQIEGGRANG